MTDRSRRFVGQLARSGAAKHRAVGMATEEHFPPPSSARVKETEKNRGFCSASPYVFRYLLMVHTSSRSGFTAERNWDEEAGRGVRAALSGPTQHWRTRAGRRRVTESLSGP